MIIESTTLERIEFEISARQSPTGTPPEFTVTVDDHGDPTGWVAGSWVDSSWNSTTGKVRALSPRFGAGGEIPIAADNTLVVWARWARGDELVVRRAVVLNVR